MQILAQLQYDDTKKVSHQAKAQGPEPKNKISFVLRVRQEREWAPCVENSCSQKRQHNVVVAAVPSSVVFLSKCHWTATHPPLLIN